MLAKLFCKHMVESMPTTNYDSSELTRRRRAMALYAYASQNTAAIAAGQSVRPEQTSFPTLDVVIARQQGGCYCTEARNGTYPKNGCGCSGTS
jgi:hypothetical protein